MKEKLFGNLVGMGLSTAGMFRAHPRRRQERSLDWKLGTLDLNQAPFLALYVILT